MDNCGTLFICATPIGNLEDITLRALRTLKEVDLIAAEDTRHTQKLLNYYDINTKLTSYHEHNEVSKGKLLINQLLSGKNIALVSDAGMPAISDPGYNLVVLCIEHNINMTVIPGASALTAALVLSGMNTRRFVFEGFLPHNKKESVLDELKKETRTIVLYEAPHRLVKTLDILISVLGENRNASIARELSKRYEEVKRATLVELYNYYIQNIPKGELVIIVEGLDLKTQKKMKWDNLTVYEHVEMYLSSGMSEKEAIKKTAKDRDVPKNDIYSVVKVKS